MCYNKTIMSVKSKNKYAVVDLEATSASSTATIIQVGIVILQDGQVIDEFASDVNPHEPLDNHIIQLTGITDDQLAQAPDFSQIAKRIFDMIEDCIFVAHNVKFDANLLAEALFMEGYELRTPRVDTVELAQVFYPTLEKYNLSYLAEVLNLDLTQAHTAIADARATSQLLLDLIGKISSLPKQTLDTILAFSDNLLFESELVILDALRQSSSSISQDYILHPETGLVFKQAKLWKEEHKLSQDFATNIALLGLDERPQQAEFAACVSKSLDNEVITMIQAQTGLGKTYGYLLSLLAQEGTEKILVAVPSKLLQDQIMHQEAKKISQIFHINCHSLKGPQNYIKLDAFYTTLSRMDSNRLVNRYKMQLLVWLTETETGDLDEIRQKQRFMAYFDDIKHDGKINADSLFKDLDFWQRSYHRAQEARVVITNHAYLLTRMEDDHAFVKGRYLVIDEGQKMVLALEQFSRRRLNLTKLLQVIHKLLEEEERSLLDRRLLESVQFEISHLLRDFQLHPEKSYDRKQLKGLLQSLEELNTSDDLLLELKGLTSRVYSSFWLETDVYQEHRTAYLNAARQGLIRLADYLPDAKKVLITSATLELGDHVDVATLLGLSQVDKIHLPMAKSPKQALWIDSSMPLIGEVPDQDYDQALAERLVSLAKQDYPVLALFTSRKSMMAVSDLLDVKGLRHLTQEKNGTAYNVKKRFDRGESNLLLGMGSFWEGADFAQQDCIVQVVCRLPFDNPRDPFYQKMESWFSNQGKTAFTDYSLPMTILRFKQAIGRTQRRESQRSAVLLLDKRPLVKNYGQEFMTEVSLELSVFRDEFTNFLTAMQEFMLK